MNKEFWKAALIRAIRTAAQVAIGTISSSALLSEINWPVVFSTVAVSTILSVLNSVATGLPEV